MGIYNKKIQRKKLMVYDVNNEKFRLFLEK